MLVLVLLLGDVLLVLLVLLGLLLERKGVLAPMLITLAMMPLQQLLLMGRSRHIHHAKGIGRTMQVER